MLASRPAGGVKVSRRHVPGVIGTSAAGCQVKPLSCTSMCACPWPAHTRRRARPGRRSSSACDAGQGEQSSRRVGQAGHERLEGVVERRGLAIAWHAKSGELDVASLPREHREFYFRTTLLTKDNAQKFLDTVVAAKGDRDWNDIWVNVTGQIRY